MKLHEIERSGNFHSEVYTWNSGGGCMIDSIVLKNGYIIQITAEILNVGNPALETDMDYMDNPECKSHVGYMELSELRDKYEECCPASKPLTFVNAIFDADDHLVIVHENNILFTVTDTEVTAEFGLYHTLNKKLTIKFPETK